MISSRSSRNSSTSSMLATVCSSAILLIALLGNHVADACSCLGPTDICAALLAQDFLVRATIISRTEDDNPDVFAITQYYSVKIEEVYANGGAHNVVEGQTVEVSSLKEGSLCGISFEIGADYLLDLTPRGGDKFTTGLCNMNSRIDENGAITRSDYQECFEKTLDLEGLDTQYDGVYLLQQLKVNGVLVSPQPEPVIISLRKRVDTNAPGLYAVALVAQDRFWTQIKIESLAVTEGHKRVDQIVTMSAYDTLPSMDNEVTDNLVATAFSTLTQIELENNGNLELKSADGDTTFLCELFESIA